MRRANVSPPGKRMNIAAVSATASTRDTMESDSRDRPLGTPLPSNRSYASSSARSAPSLSPSRRPSWVAASQRAAKMRGTSNGARVMKRATVATRFMRLFPRANPAAAPLSICTGDPLSTAAIEVRSSCSSPMRRVSSDEVVLQPRWCKRPA
jgi:hypothetical protein